MIQVINGQITAYKLPRVGTLSSGETVSGYHLLPKATLKEEGWLPVEDNPPEYNSNTHYLQPDGYEVLKTKAKKRYRVVEIPKSKPDEIDVLKEKNKVLEDKLNTTANILDYHEDIMQEVIIASLK